MGSGVGHPDLALYRLIKSGEAGLNLGLSDLFDKRIELPSFASVIRALLLGKKISVTVKAYPASLIERLLAIQRAIDKEIEKEITKAKSGIG